MTTTRPNEGSAPTGPGPASATSVRYRRFWLVALAVLVLDQLTKAWILCSVPYGANPADGGVITVIPDFFYIIHVTNTGAAWSLFSGYPRALGLLGFIALAAIYWFREHLELRRPFVQIVFGLLVGGIVGNMIDRFAYGHVVDFLDFHFGSYRYPAFNVADCGITVGVALYFLLALLDARKPGKSKD